MLAVKFDMANSVSRMMTPASLAMTRTPIVDLDMDEVNHSWS